MVDRRAFVLALVIACGPKTDRTVPPAPGSNTVSEPADATPALDASVAITPPDAAMRPIEDLPEHLRANLPTVSIDGTESLLGYLGARLTAPGSVGARVIAADAIAAGTVTRSEVIPHAPSKAFLADPALRAHAPDGPGGRMLFVSVVELAADRWLRGRGGKVAKVVWEAPEEDTGEGPGLPAVGATGLLLMRPLPRGPIGKELGAAVRGARGLELRMPIIVPDDDGALAAALAAKPSQPAFAKALGALHGGALQVYLAYLSKLTSKGVGAALAARIAAGADDVDTLLVRATLFRLGDRKVAAAGIDAETMDAAVLEELGIVVLEKNDQRLGLSGPERTTPLP